MGVAGAVDLDRLLVGRRTGRANASATCITGPAGRLARAAHQGPRELERSLGKLALDESQREGVEALTQAMVNKILHAPLTRLRREAEREEGLVYLEVARLLFGLDDEDPPGGGETR